MDQRRTILPWRVFAFLGRMGVCVRYFRTIVFSSKTMNLLRHRNINRRIIFNEKFSSPQANIKANNHYIQKKNVLPSKLKSATTFSKRTAVLTFTKKSFHTRMRSRCPTFNYNVTEVFLRSLFFWIIKKDSHITREPATLATNTMKVSDWLIFNYWITLSTKLFLRA